MKEWIKLNKKYISNEVILWKIASAVFNKPIHELWDTIADHHTLNHGLHRYLAGEPLTKIRGYTDFYRMNFKTGPEVLDPRPETELIVDLVIQNNPKSVLDLGTGSGCIACSIARSLKDTYIVGCDISEAAIKIAQYNAKQLDVNVNFILSDWCANVKGTFDAIVGNPPYISTNDQLPIEVWAYDPNIALEGGLDGCNEHRKALPQLQQHLKPGGLILWEIGYNQGAWIKDYASKIFVDYKEIKIIKDWNDHDRVLYVKW